MDDVLLTREGKLFRATGEAIGDPLPVLSSALALADGATLRSFTALLKAYPELLRISEFLPIVMAESDACPPSGCLSDDISILVVGKTMELIGFPGKPRAELYIWLRGLHLPSGASETSPPLNLRMEADRETRFVPLQILLDTPLFLGGLKHVILGDVDRSLYCETRFTLFEVVDGLAWEFGFQGGSQQCSLGR